MIAFIAEKVVICCHRATDSVTTSRRHFLVEVFPDAMTMAVCNCGLLNQNVDHRSRVLFLK